MKILIVLRQTSSVEVNVTDCLEILGVYTDPVKAEEVHAESAKDDTYLRTTTLFQKEVMK